MDSSGFCTETLTKFLQVLLKPCCGHQKQMRVNGTVSGGTGQKPSIMATLEGACQGHDQLLFNHCHRIPSTARSDCCEQSQESSLTTARNDPNPLGKTFFKKGESLCLGQPLDSQIKWRRVTLNDGDEVPRRGLAPSVDWRFILTVTGDIDLLSSGISYTYVMGSLTLMLLGIFYTHSHLGSLTLTMTLTGAREIAQW